LIGAPTVGAAESSSSPEFVSRPPRGPYRALNPTTKLVIALSEAFAAFALGGWIAPSVVLLAVVTSAWLASALQRLVIVAAVSLPVIGSILLINTFLLPGASDPIIHIAFLAPTWSGLSFGLQVTIRLMAASLALALVYLTTDVGDLLDDLERRGLGRRAAFVVGSAIQAVPRTVERAAEIVDAQRARGLDTEGSIARRVRGVVPLAAPLIFGALTDVEERTMALEARAFTAPGRRTVLRRLPDSTAQRIARWLLGLGTIVVIAASVAGRLRLP